VGRTEFSDCNNSDKHDKGVARTKEIGMDAGDIKTRLERLEWKLDQLSTMLMQMIGRKGGESEGDAAKDLDAVEVLSRLTTKQHAAMQMLVQGASNAKIAERFGVTENTAKVYVRSIAGKLGVSSRMQVVLSVVPLLEMVAPKTYEIMSGGLPLDWASKYEERGEPDRWRDLYRFVKEEG